MLDFDTGAVTLSFFTTLTTHGTPLEVDLEALRIEQSFPADGATRRALEACDADLASRR